MLATLHPEVAGVGKFGELIVYVLGEWRAQRGEPKISYGQLAQMLESRGIRDPKTQLPIIKSRVTSYATDRALAPKWFLVALGEILGGPEVGFTGDWWKTWAESGQLSVTTIGRNASTVSGVRYRTVDVDQSPPMSHGGLRKYYMPQKSNQSWRRIPLPDIIICETAVGLPIDRDLAMPHWRPGQAIAFVDTARPSVTLDKIYAVTEENGDANFRKAVWDPERERMILRSSKVARGRYPDVSAESIQGDFAHPEKPKGEPRDLGACWVDGLVFCVQLEQVAEGEVPPLIINPKGVEIENW